MNKKGTDMQYVAVLMLHNTTHHYQAWYQISESAEKSLTEKKVYRQTDRQTVCLFVCFIALRPKSTAMVIAGRSVHLTTLFPGQA